MSATPLAGVKVLEFSHTVMGPTAGLVLADLGADVIKVEPAPSGDHTRGMAIANAHAAIKMGVAQFDTTVGGLGGCPFAGQKGAAGNICSEELVLLCEEMGIHTGVDLDRLIEVGRMAEAIVGHVLPSELIHAGSLGAFRRKAA